jgi:hypothetical protein
MLNRFARWVSEELEGGEDRIFEMIAEGDKTMKVIAAGLKSEAFPDGVSRGLLYSWIKMGGDERRVKFDAAREIRAHGLVEEGLDILDNTIAATSQDVTLAVARANYRKWLASKQNRDEYDERQQGPLINVSLNSLHLDALRAGNRQIPEAQFVELPSPQQGEE